MENSAHQDTYADCFLNGHGERGPVTAKRVYGLFLFSEVNDDVESHFKTLKIKLPEEKDSLASLRTEKGLILDRVNFKLKNASDASKICPKHRYCNGTYHIRQQSAHPKHGENRRKHPQKQKRINCRVAPTSLVEKIRFHFKFHFPVGGQLCTTCRNIEEKRHSCDEVDDQESDDSGECFQSAATISDLNSSIKEIAPTISPFKFQLRSPVNTVASSTQRYLKRKLDICVQAVTDFLCESVAPGQGEEIKKRLVASAQEGKQLVTLK